MNTKLHLGGALVAVALSLVCTNFGGCEAQKTAQRWSSQSSSQSVYGGYQPQQQSVVEQQRPVSYSQQKSRVQTSYQHSSAVAPVRRPQPQPEPQQQQQQQQQQESAYESSSSDSDAAEADAEPASYGAVNGQPGKDFPAYTRVPKTSFSCDGLPYDYGMYADEETGCQAYHLCYNGRKESFLCGVGTVFNQRILHCDYWYSVECGKSSQYYSSNAYMGSSQPEPGPAEANAAPAVSQQSSSSSSYGRTVSRPAGPGAYKQQQQAASSSFSRNTQQTQESY